MGRNAHTSIVMRNGNVLAGLQQDWFHKTGRHDGPKYQGAW